MKLNNTITDKFRLAALIYNSAVSRICSFLHIKSRDTFYFLIMFLACGYMLLWNLDANSMWDDEASTAVFAKNILKTGKLTGWDGRNLYSFRQGTLLYDDYHSRETPAQCYVTALSFKLFGVSTWAARIPFVMFGLASLIMFWLVLGKSFAGFPLIRLYAFPLLAFSYSFLLSSRESRYYSLALFLILASYYLYIRIIERPRTLFFALFTAALSALFFTHGILFAATALSIALIHMLFHRKIFCVKEWILSGACTLIASAFLLPYALKFRIWERPDLEAQSLFSKPVIIFWNFRELDMINFLPFMGITLLGIFIVKYRKRNFLPQAVYQWLFIIVSMTIFISLLTFQNADWQGFTKGLSDIRYLFAVLPFCAGSMGVFLWILHRGLGAKFSLAVLTAMLCSTLLTLNVGNEIFRWPLPGLIYEIHNDYVTPYDTAVSYLKKHALSGESVYSLPEYTQNVLHFYLGDSLIMGSQLRRGKSRLPIEPLSKTGFVPYIEDYFPNWIVAFSMSQDHAKYLDLFSRGAYVYSLVQNISIYWQDRTRPELPLHSFLPFPIPPNPNAGILIFKRVNKTELINAQSLQADSILTEQEQPGKKLN